MEALKLILAVYSLVILIGCNLAYVTSREIDEKDKRLTFIFMPMILYVILTMTNII